MRLEEIWPVQSLESPTRSLAENSGEHDVHMISSAFPTVRGPRPLILPSKTGAFARKERFSGVACRSSLACVDRPARVTKKSENGGRLHAGVIQKQLLTSAIRGRLNNAEIDLRTTPTRDL